MREGNVNPRHTELPPPAVGRAVKLDRRDSVTVADDLDVTPRDPSRELVSSERLEGGLFCCEPDSRVLRRQRLVPYVRRFSLGKEASIHAIAERLDHVRHAIDLDEVQAHPDNHERAP